MRQISSLSIPFFYLSPAAATLMPSSCRDKQNRDLLLSLPSFFSPQKRLNNFKKKKAAEKKKTLIKTMSFFISSTVRTSMVCALHALLQWALHWWRLSGTRSGLASGLASGLITSTSPSHSSINSFSDVLDRRFSEERQTSSFRGAKSSWHHSDAAFLRVSIMEEENNAHLRRITSSLLSAEAKNNA